MTCCGPEIDEFQFHQAIKHWYAAERDGMPGFLAQHQRQATRSNVSVQGGDLKKICRLM